MSTMGREADEIAAQVREQERRRAEKANRCEVAVRFAVAALKDKNLSDIVARRLALDALARIERL